jgi:hypothetical protein
VSRRGVAFVPDKEAGKAEDAFTLRHNEFLYALADDSLIVRSNTRTYSFKAADVADKDNRARLQKVVDSIRRLDPATPAK